MDTPVLTAKSVRAHVGARNYEQGQRYAARGALYQARRLGRTLKAHCEGSQDRTYDVTATVGPKAAIDAGCSCPVGGGGRCKHVAALLLSWLANPESFVELEPLGAVLARRSKEELIALIQQLVTMQPDLELLVATPLPSQKHGVGPVRQESFRRQVEVAFRRGGHEWGAAHAIATEVEKVKSIGDGFLAQKDVQSAAVVYEAICAEVMERYHEVRDDDGDISQLINDCVARLGECLTTLYPGDGARETILRTLFDVTAFDITSGGISFGEEAGGVLVERTTPSERSVIAGWVRAALERSSDWGRSSFGGLLLALEGDTLDDEAYLKVCRETGRVVDLVERLLERRRWEDAIMATRSAMDYELLYLADRFVAHNQGETAESLVEERARGSRDSRLLEWLKKRHAARGDSRGALDLALKLFDSRPSRAAYKELRRLGQKAGRWSELRPRLLERAAKDSSTMVEIHLEEGALEEALRLVKVPRPPIWGDPYQHRLLFEVAKAAENAHPREVREIHRQYAEALIETGGRDNYRVACGHLKKVRKLYERTEGPDAWDRFIAELRDRNRKRRALLEELTKARL
ncbi:MAG: SWIM zinc finger family protein [Myxococcaceae bacterium]|nr:SWIM zinc finger family protein [Myxococcaceae bacterium]